MPGGGKAQKSVSDYEVFYRANYPATGTAPDPVPGKFYGYLLFNANVYSPALLQES